MSTNDLQICGFSGPQACFLEPQVSSGFTAEQEKLRRTVVPVTISNLYKIRLKCKFYVTPARFKFTQRSEVHSHLNFSLDKYSDVNYDAVQQEVCPPLTGEASKFLKRRLDEANAEPAGAHW